MSNKELSGFSGSLLARNQPAEPAPTIAKSTCFTITATLIADRSVTLENRERVQLQVLPARTRREFYYASKRTDPLFITSAFLSTARTWKLAVPRSPCHTSILTVSPVNVGPA